MFTGVEEASVLIERPGLVRVAWNPSLMRRIKNRRANCTNEPPCVRCVVVTRTLMKSFV